MGAARELRVLYIVDGDASVRAGLSRLASARGFEPRSFASIQQVLAQDPDTAVGCVLVDSSLLGAQDAAALGGSWWGSRLPLIVLSAGADDLSRRDARTFGARFLLNKPVDAMALFDAIAWVTDAN